VSRVIAGALTLAAVVSIGGEWPAVHAQTVGAAASKQPSAQTVYVCQKTDEKIRVDGVLDEDAWRRASPMRFVGIVDESAPPFFSEAKMLWDDKYLYAGYYFEEPDIRAYWGIDESDCSEQIRDAFLGARGRPKDGAWSYLECTIMRIDRFAKLFIDPDGDGDNYVEFQINPLNVRFDSWYKQGFADGQWENRERFPSVEWKCPGLLSATRVYGSVNAPHDVDKGWSLEIAIPWTSLAPFTKGACPPVSGDVWGGHLGRVYRDRTGGANEYWVWPFLGVCNCHLPDRYGKVVFKDELRRFERFFVWGAGGEDEARVAKMARMGVTDVIGGTPSPKAAELLAKYHMKAYPCVTLSAGGWEKRYPGTPPALQKMTDAEVAARDMLDGVKSPHRPAPGAKDGVDAPADWNVTDKQRKALEALAKTNYKWQSNYQWGGEPVGLHFGGRSLEVLTTNLLCFNAPETRELMKERIKTALASPAVSGVAFDFIGYQNYHACYCPVCNKLFQEYCARNKLSPAHPKSRNAFSLDCLVEFNNEMVDYAHSLKPGCAVVNHVYPAFTPEPLYGNRLKVDFCGQTAAWYQYWDLWRIEKYSRTIAADAEKHWPGVKGVAFIGYYDNPAFPVKTPERVEAELRAILRGGATQLMMCGLNDLLKNDDVCDVFAKFCAPRPQGKVK